MNKKTIKKKNTGSNKVVADKELQSAIELFPKIVKKNEKAAREKQRIIKNFLSVKNKIF